MILQLKARNRRATACPMRPSPTMPTVLPCTSFPHIHSGSQTPHDPSRAAVKASPTRRAVTRRRATVRSAVVSVRQSGVKPSWIPFSLSSAVSTWLYPTLMVETILRRLPAASTSPLVTLSVSSTNSPSAPARTRDSSSSGGIAFSVWSKTSNSIPGTAFSRSMATWGICRVTTTRNFVSAVDIPRLTSERGLCQRRGAR
mmetsp:Transcript_19440/g.39644  ORF Transcript_19440/g.39644 Transcript_19440/m.39644 type:complete len:200 (+) Transcript_19440:120-719(+)